MPTLFNQFFPASRLAGIAVLLMLFTGVLSAEPNDKLLARERWQEDAYGVSLRPPLGARIVEQTADEALARISGEGYSFAVSIKKTSRDLTAADMAANAIEQLALAEPSAVIVDQPEIRPAGRPGAMVYYDIPERHVAIGHVFMQIDPRTYVMLRLECDMDQFPRVRRVFDAVTGSLALADPKEMDRLREEQLQAAETWMEGIDRARLKAAVEPEKWFRIQTDGNDVGYVVMRMNEEEQMEQPGLRIELQGRILLNNQVVDTLSTFFESNDGMTEIWSIKTTIRQQQGRKPGKKDSPTQALPGHDGVTWVETGLRATESLPIKGKENKEGVSRQVITVTRQAPGKGPVEYKWAKPPRGYLSQVAIFLLPKLIDAGQGRTLGFYAYSPTAGRLLFRTERVTPRSQEQGGGFILHSRLGQDQDEQVTEFDARSAMIRRQLPDGSVMLPASKQDIARVWQIR